MNCALSLAGLVSKLYPRVRGTSCPYPPVPCAGVLLYRVVTWMLLTKPSNSPETDAVVHRQKIILGIL